MKKNLYFRHVFQRSRVFRDFVFSVLIGISIVPKNLIEPFLRRNMGERYYSLGVNILTAWGVYYFFFKTSNGISYYHYTQHNTDDSFIAYVVSDPLFFIYLIIYVSTSISRWYEIQRNPSVFDFGKFSLSSGDIHPLFAKLKFKGVPVSRRAIEIAIEPLLVFSIGFIASYASERLGWLLMISSFFYGVRNWIAYKLGDDYLMDQIDQAILNEQFANAYVENRDTTETKGVNVTARRPASKTSRKNIFDRCVREDDDEFEGLE